MDFDGLGGGGVSDFSSDIDCSCPWRRAFASAAPMGRIRTFDFLERLVDLLLSLRTDLSLCLALAALVVDRNTLSFWFCDLDIMSNFHVLWM